MRNTTALALVATLGLGLSACSLGGDEPKPSTPAPSGDAPATSEDQADSSGDAAASSTDVAGSTEAAGSTAAGSGEVVLVTHDSFSLPDELLAQFTEETGYTVKVQTSGDAGQLTNQLVLTKDSPIGDAVFGVDNTLGARAVKEGILAPHTAKLPKGAKAHLLPGGEDVLTPVDYGDVCVNIDTTWFEEKGLNPPQTLQDLTDKQYKDLFVTPGATTSSPGLAFLIATVGEFGPDGWQDYWKDLMANGAKVTQGWTDAYTVDFTAGGGKGDRPIVLSYASSPPFTIPEGGSQPTTKALLDTCFRQVEYAGVLQGAKNPEGAAALVDWLVTRPVQEAVPDAMYMYPVDASATLPDLWKQFAPLAEDPIVVHPEQIDTERDGWLKDWADIATG